MKYTRVFMLTITIFLLINILLINIMVVSNVHGQNRESGSVFKRARLAIDYYDQNDAVDSLRWALNLLLDKTYVGPFHPWEAYLLAEAELKIKIDSLKRGVEDSLIERLEQQVRSRTGNLWNSVKNIEESPDPEVSEAKALRMSFARCLQALISVGRFVDNANFTSVLLKRLCDRAHQHGFLRTYQSGTNITVTELAFLKARELLPIDYPNPKYLSNILGAHDILASVRKKPKWTLQDSLLAEKATSFALSAEDVTQSSRGKCLAHFLAALGKEKKDPEGAIDNYYKSLMMFNDFGDFDSTYLVEEFGKEKVTFEFIQFVYAYSKRLQEEGNFLRSVTLLEGVWRIEEVSKDFRCTLASYLQEGYAKLIAQLRADGQDEIAEGYQDKLDKISIYVAFCQQT